MLLCEYSYSYLQQCVIPNVKMVGHVIDLDCALVQLDLLIIAVRWSSHEVGCMCSIGKIHSHNSRAVK